MTACSASLRRNNPAAILRALGLTLLGVSLLPASALASPPADIPAAIGSPADLLASLEGETCQGAMALTKVAGGDAAPVSTPVRLQWFRRADGSH